MKKKAMLFDMDGTLIDTFTQMTNELSGKVSLSRRYFDYRMSKQDSYSYKAMVNMIDHDPIMRFQKTKIKKNVMDMMYQRYDKACLKPGAKAFLLRAKEAGYQLCLCTNNASDMVAYILKQKGLENIFDFIITSEIVKKPKPDPEMYLKAVEFTNLSVQECIVFEDMLEGVEAAKAANIEVCAVYDSYNESDIDKIKALATFMITDYHSTHLDCLFE